MCTRMAHLPELHDHRVLFMIAPSIVDVGLHVGHIQALTPATDQHLNLLLAEHGHPVLRHQVIEASPEGFAAAFDLEVQAVIGNPVDVLHHILRGHSFAAPAWHQFHLK